jgi:transmembrane protein TMEM174 (potassium channel)
MPEPSPARGAHVSRIEGFSDAVFAFALTLLVVSLEVPKTFEELRGTLRGFVPFAACFAILVWIWHSHHVFFRRYGLVDGTTILLTAVLLFVVLFYVYPLKYLFTALAAWFLGVEPAAHGWAFPRGGEGLVLMRIYGGGYVAVFGIFALLYAHAWRKRGALGLDVEERFETKMGIGIALVNVGIGAISVGIALAGRPEHAGAAGWIYAATGPAIGAVHAIARTRHERTRRSAGARADSAGATQAPGDPDAP